ncbi:cytochrome P450 [Amycolatopsis acidiphila]|uniref:Cytochrome P450 n=1 Tax=Amycolatopsis acidiphila TaxID=715473 RepID=A0A558AKG2_9PSEU|nr:cytochrome P450 [Amycolatopsis acidiphila]TVT24749.1 cytochrome P450 [Amycolatopsis acidiphila]UIJ62717.1 cytochrome P450 [Amycolatopsis acidiphila]GHG63768.1 cytochrome P450 [Amycolatopsis acidiphila]
MNRTEFQLAFRTLRFLDAHADLPQGSLPQRTEPEQRYLVWDPAAIGELFRADQRLGHPGSRSFRPLLGPRSLLWQEGPRHLAYRRVLGTPLRGRQLRDYRAVIAGTVHAALDGLRPGDTIRVSDWTRRVALRIMATIVFGHADDELLVPFARWMDRALGSRYRTLAYRYLRGGLPLLDKETEALLVATARTAARENPATLAGKLLADDGPFPDLDDGELRDQLVSLLFAGHETTASTAAWALFWLDREDALRDRVLAELAATSDDGFSAEQVPVLHAVVQETLRITPPVPAAGNRVLPESCPHHGNELPAGTVLTPSIYLAHHRAESFPDPHRFDPDRFLRGRVPADRYFPFGGGTRHCLGSQLGQLEVRMLVAALLRRRELRCVNPSAGVPQLRGHAMAPSPKLRMRVLSCRD